MPKDKDGDIDLIIVVNGQPVSIEARAHEVLRAAAQQAFEQIRQLRSTLRELGVARRCRQSSGSRQQDRRIPLP